MGTADRPASGAVKAVTVEPTLVEGARRGSTGRGSSANAAANPAVTLLFAACSAATSLLVDGTAEAVGADVRVTPTAPCCTVRPPTRGRSGRRARLRRRLPPRVVSPFWVTAFDPAPDEHDEGLALWG